MSPSDEANGKKKNETARNNKKVSQNKRKTIELAIGVW
jgi:hypothetical protein